MAATGLDHAPFADVPPEMLGPIFGRLPELSRVEANRIVMAEVFGRLDAQAALPGLMELMASWQPDVVVREFCEFGSLAAAEKAQVPHVEVAIGLAAAYGSALLVVASPLAELRRTIANKRLPSWLAISRTRSRSLATTPPDSAYNNEIRVRHRHCQVVAYHCLVSRE